MSTVGNEQVKTRTPKCARCRNHGYTVNLRGHKGFCPHKNCTCDLCDLVKERQEVSKRQIKLRRQQQQEEVLGMYVPVPPTVFSQGSACGINLDYLRVLFPRKRVDRLYAVLLQCNNDVNAAKATLQQEEHLEEASGSFMGLTKTSPPVPVMKMNKATQWPADCDQDTAGAAPKTGGTMVTSSKGWQQCNLKNAGDFHHNVSHHGSFPYCWPRALPSQFPPAGPVSLPAHNVFGATSPPRFKDHIFNPEPFPPENSAPLEGFESTCSNVSGHAKAGEPIRETQRMTEPVCTSLLQPQPLTTSQGLAGSVPQMTSLENGCVNPNCTQLSSSTAKTSSWGGDPIYTSASSAMTWMDVPVSLPMPRTAIHFSLPPLPLPPLASGWDPRSLPPLPFLPASMTMTAPFPFPPPHLSDSPAVPHVKEVGSIPEKAGDVLTSPDDLILTAMENSSVKMKPDVKIAPGDNDISALEPCEDSEQFIDPTGF